MSSVSESAASNGPLGAALSAGLDAISGQQIVSFTQYSQYISPVDGLVYWVQTANTVSAKGSLHFATDFRQEEDAQYGRNRVTFTSEVPINDFNAIGPTTIYVANLGEFYYSFSSSKNFYRQANLYHYQGDAVYPMMLTQLVTSTSLINNAVISNSLPIWLSLAASLSVDMLPSFLATPNMLPPYVTVHIGEDDTESLQSIGTQVPVYQIGSNGQPVTPLVTTGYTHDQLCKDRVRLTCWGMSNQAVMTFFDGLIAYMINNDNLGLMNAPMVRDSKKLQPEMHIVGQKKVISFEVSYYQSYAYNQAVQLITSALPTILLGAA